MTEHEKKHHAAKARHPKKEEIEHEEVETAVAQLAEPRMKGAVALLKEVFGQWKGHWKIFTGIQLLWAAAFLGVMILGAIVLGFATASSGMFSGAMTPQDISSALLGNPGLLAGLIVGLVIASAVVIVISTWMSLATVQAWAWTRKEEQALMGVRSAYIATWPLVPGYIWISILASILIGIGLFGLVLPGIMLSIALSLLSSVVVIEKLKGRHAIMRTTRLARPYLLTIFWRGLVTGVALYVPGMIGAAILNTFSQGIGDAVNQLYGLVVSPILGGVLYATYLEIKKVEKKSPHEVWLSLERMAFIGALVVGVVLAVALIFGQG